MCLKYSLIQCGDRFWKRLFTELYDELNLQIQLCVFTGRLEL